MTYRGYTVAVVESSKYSALFRFAQAHPSCHVGKSDTEAQSFPVCS